MFQVELSGAVIFFAALTSLFCVLVALFAAFFGGFEEKVLGAMIAAASTGFCAIEFGFLSTNGVEVRSIEVAFVVFELVLSLWVALKTKIFWPLMVASIFLVKASIILVQYFNFPVGIFAREEVQIILRFCVAVIILTAVFAGMKMNSATSSEHDRT